VRDFRLFDKVEDPVEEGVLLGCRKEVPTSPPSFDTIFGFVIVVSVIDLPGEPRIVVLVVVVFSILLFSSFVYRS